MEDAGNGALAVEVGVDGNREDATGGEIAAPRFEVLLRTPEGVQADGHREQVAREFRPRRIILFGSYATGSATAHSDVDLVVVMPFRGSDTDKVVEIRGRVEAPFPMDLLVWKPAEERKSDSFTRSVLNAGRVWYEAGDA